MNKQVKALYLHFFIILLLVVVVGMLVRPGSLGPQLVGGFTDAVSAAVAFASA